jgi:Ca2+-transporting ATPase
VRAIAEGSQLFHNLRMSCAYLLFVHIPLVISAALIPFMGFPLLYLPIHIVWLELIIHPTALLAYQQLPDHESVLKTRAGARFFTRSEWMTVVLTGLLLTAALVSGYIANIGDNNNVEHARAMALAVLCLGSAFITSMLSGLSTVASRLVVAGTILSALLLIQIPVLAGILHLQPIHLQDWAGAFLAAGLIALLPKLARFGRSSRR